MIVAYGARNVGPVRVRSTRILRVLGSRLVLPRSPRRMCFCNDNIARTVGPQVGSLLRRTFPKTGMRTRKSVVKTTETLFNGGPNVTYVLNAKTGDYLCSNAGVIVGAPPLKCVLNSRNDNTILNGLFLGNVFGNDLPSTVGGEFLG